MSTPLAFVWNDDQKKAQDWATLANGNSDCCSWAQDPDVVAAAFREKQPDLVVLDLLLGNDQALGKTIGRRIRKEDKIVPIVFVTRNPGKLYDNFFEIEEVDVCGLFDVGVMATTRTFSDFVVRGALANWHSLAPDFPLVRKVVAAMERQKPKQGSMRDTAQALIKQIEELPLHGSLQRWHTELAKQVKSYLIALQWPGLAARFEELIEIFHTADPFYMAGVNSRKHLSHNVQVFLLGSLFILEVPTLRASAESFVAKTDPQLPERDRIWAALGVWACIALTHDVAYLSQSLVKITDVLRSCASRFEAAAGPGDKQLPEWKWPQVHHGIRLERILN